MVNRLTKVWSIAVAAALEMFVSASTLRAQSSAPTKSLRAYGMSSPIRVDGVLDEPGWKDADAATDFVQQDPRTGEPATETTDVRVLVDEEAIYFGFACHDSDPGGIVARELRRDNAFADDDHFDILLDTFHDHRNAFHFAITPRGTQYDALITDEGHDINTEWNERWWSAARIMPDGWTAEIRIPLTTLRSNRALDTLGVNFRRFIRRRSETAHWTAWSRDFPFLQVSQAGHLAGVEGLRTGLTLRVKPYVLGGFRDDPARTDVERLPRRRPRDRAVQRHVRADGRAHGEHRLRPNGSRRRGGEPHAISGVLPRETGIWLTTTIAQYDSAASRHVLFFRLNYIFRPGDNLFFVFNQTRQPAPRGGDQRERAVMVKMTYALDF